MVLFILQLMSQMGGKFEDLADKPLEQDAMEGVEDHEWVG